MLNFQETTENDFGVPASSIDRSKIVAPERREQIRDEIPTLNRTGYMKLALDEYSKAFIDRASSKGTLALEIGCAYGFVVQQLLAAGGKVVACDLSEEHLTYVAKHVAASAVDRLFLKQGRLPEVDFPTESFGSILISRVLHFLTPEEVEQSLVKIFSWLKPGGKFYFTSVTPYHDAFRHSYLAIYKAKEESGEAWPGVVESQWDIAPKHQDYVQPYINMMDIPQLAALLPKYGFTIEGISLFDYPGDTDSGGRGHVGFVASKMEDY